VAHSVVDRLLGRCVAPNVAPWATSSRVCYRDWKSQAIARGTLERSTNAEAIRPNPSSSIDATCGETTCFIPAKLANQRPAECRRTDRLSFEDSYSLATSIACTLTVNKNWCQPIMNSPAAIFALAITADAGTRQGPLEPPRPLRGQSLPALAICAARPGYGPKKISRQRSRFVEFFSDIENTVF